ncbi:MAG: site-specific integrase [Candidatus Lambdaproteobacteria bacterium]|nr:site-specific integrase [Candidatus Lambdaproteobacteria bacterium]
MAFLTDTQELKPGLIIFRRADVKHRNWYCRIKVPQQDRYKTVSLKTSDLNEARDKAFDHDADIRFRVKHEVPIFEKSFEQVATEYSDYQKSVAQSGQITHHRWECVDSYIRLHLIPYMGSIQITHVGEDKWRGYPLWRKQNGKSIGGGPPKDSTIRHEMMTFRAVMNYAASKQYIRENQVPRGKLPSDKGRREEFTPQEYRHLHTFARGWIKEARSEWNAWYRNMAYNFMLVMTNTGMRTMEARNLRWRDVDVRTDRQGRPFVCINVRGKDKFRELVAAQNVASYLERIKALSKATKPDDFVFTTHKGKSAITLYQSAIGSLLKESELLRGPTGTIRSAYCFRHTYATFRLKEGIDVYFLAKQMGTSVKMIEEFYGHITPVKNAERILQGIPGWEPIAGGGDEPTGSVNAGGAGAKPAKPRKKK